MTGLSKKNAVKYGKIENVKEWLGSIRETEEINKLLVCASRSHHANVEMLEVLIDAGADPNYYEIHKIGDETYYGGEPLSCAAYSGDIDKVKFLLSNGATTEGSRSVKGSIMHAAVNGNTENREEVIKYFISLGVDIDGENKSGGTPLSSASRDGKFEAIKLLLNAGADSSELGWDELKKAIVFGTLEECEEAIKRGCSVEERDRYWKRTPFLLSMLVGDVEKAELLLQNGASLNDRGRCEATCLMHSIRKNNYKMCKWLISKGVNVDDTDDFQTTALIEAAEFGASDCVKALLNAGASLHAETETQGCAIENASNIATVLVLKEAGADINRIGGDGYNLLLSATENADYDFVKALLEIDADPNVTSTGEIPLHKASWGDEIEIMKLLLDYGSNPNAKDVDDETPLHRIKSAEAAQIFINAGGKTTIKNIVGQTAIDYANDDRIKAVLLSKAG